MTSKHTPAILILLILISVVVEGQTWKWARQAGGNLWDEGEGICGTNNGNLYVTGRFFDVATFENDTIVSTNRTFDIFLAKYDTSGALRWVRKAGGLGDGFEHGTSIVVDREENVYLTGYFENTATFDSISISAYSSVADIFLAKYTVNGDLLWVRHFDSGNGAFSGAYEAEISTDDYGNVYLCGHFQGVFPSNKVVFDGDTLTVRADKSIFIAKYNENGIKQWIKTAHGIVFDQRCNIATDENGNSFIAGYFNDTAYFENDVLISKGDNDVFIAGYDGNGTLLWVKQGGGAQRDEACDIDVDLKGNIFVSGIFYSDSISFEATNIASDSLEHAFLLKYNYQGDLLWAKRMPGMENHIAADRKGNCFMAGLFHGGPIYAGNDTLLAATFYDAYMLMADSNGVILSALQSERHPSNLLTHINITDVGTDYSGGCYLVGYFAGNYSFGVIPFNSSDTGSNNILLAKAYFPDALPASIAVDQRTSLLASLYPNPMNQFTVLRFHNPELKNYTITLYDSQGRIVRDMTTRSNQVVIEKNNLTSGLYFFMLSSNGALHTTGKLLIE